MKKFSSANFGSKKWLRFIPIIKRSLITPALCALILLINSSYCIPSADKFVFKVLFWEKAFFLPFLDSPTTHPDFSHFVFQQVNHLREEGSNENADRRIYRLRVYAFNSSGAMSNPPPPYSLKPNPTIAWTPQYPKPPKVAYNGEIHFGNYRMSIASLRALVPTDRNDFKYLRFDPVKEDDPTAQHPGFVGYDVYPVKENGYTIPMENTLTPKAIAKVRFDPSPPA